MVKTRHGASLRQSGDIVLGQSHSRDHRCQLEPELDCTLHGPSAAFYGIWISGLSFCKPWQDNIDKSGLSRSSLWGNRGLLSILPACKLQNRSNKLKSKVGLDLEGSKKSEKRVSVGEKTSRGNQEDLCSRRFPS
jgi:hypothetical protein